MYDTLPDAPDGWRMRNPILPLDELKSKWGYEFDFLCAPKTQWDDEKPHLNGHRVIGGRVAGKWRITASLLSSVKEIEKLKLPTFDTAEELVLYIEMVKD